MAQPAPVGALEPRAKVSGKVGIQLGIRGSGKNGGDEKGGDPIRLSPLWLVGPPPAEELQKGPGRPLEIQPLLP